MTTLLLTLYTLCAISLGIYTAGQAILLWRYWRTRGDQRATPPLRETPSVTVQLPLYNEACVAGRLIDAVAALDYPRDKLTIQALDDSTDRTAPLVARKLAELRASRGYTAYSICGAGIALASKRARWTRASNSAAANSSPSLTPISSPRLIFCGACCLICWRTRPSASCRAAGGISTPTRTA